MIESIEDFGSELKLQSFGQTEILKQSEIRAPVARPTEGVARRHACRKRPDLGTAGGVGERTRSLISQIRVQERVRRITRSGAQLSRTAEVDVRRWNQAQAGRDRVRAVEDRERQSASRNYAARQREPAKDLPPGSRRVLRKRQVPNETRRKSMSSVEIRVAIIQARIERIEQSKIEVAQGLAERRT